MKEEIEIIGILLWQASNFGSYNFGMDNADNQNIDNV
jgi:hypothetical protein